MAFEGPCIVVQVTETDWYVAVPAVAQRGEYRVVSRSLGHTEAFQTCKQLSELREADWSRRHGPEFGLLPALVDLKTVAAEGNCKEPGR